LLAEQDQSRPDRHLVVRLQYDTIQVGPIGEAHVPPGLELEMLDPRLGDLDPDDPISLWYDRGEIRVDDPDPVRVGHVDAQIFQPGGRPHLDQLSSRGVERFRHSGAPIEASHVLVTERTYDPRPLFSSASGRCDFARSARRASDDDFPLNPPAPRPGT